MKAEEHGSRVRIVKYGMGESEQHKILERHVTVMEDRRAIANYHFAHVLARGPALRAAFDSMSKQAPAQPPVVTPAPPAALATDDLRSLLGLE